jgi:zinc protease
MKRLACALFLGFLAVGCAEPAGQGSGDTDGIFPFETRLVTLDNGFNAYLIRAGAPGVIAYVSNVRTGARDEVEEGRTGYAHFFEHMMFRGTEKYPEYDAITSQIGASRNAFTSLDMTVYYLVAASEYLEQIMDLESDRFQNLAYSEADFRTEAGAILGEYQQGAMTPGSVLDRNLRLAAYDTHTYRHSTIGFEEDVRNMPEGYEYSRSFFDRFYRPENVVIVIAGDFDFDEAEEMIHRYYGDWEPGYVPPAIQYDDEQTAPRDIHIDYEGGTLPVISVNYKGPAWSATDRLAVATEVLGAVAFGSNSDLYKRLVIQEGRVQYLFGGFGLARDPALLTIQTMANNEADIEPLQGEIRATVERFQTELVDAELLANTKSNMKYGFLMGLETAQNVAFSLVGYIINTGGIDAVEEYYATLDAVTAEDVREAALTYLTENRRVTAVMTQAQED